MSTKGSFHEPSDHIQDTIDSTAMDVFGVMSLADRFPAAWSSGSGLQFGVQIQTPTKKTQKEKIMGDINEEK